MTLAELMKAIKAEELTPERLSTIKTDFLNTPFAGSLEDFFQDIAENFHDFANHNPSLIWQSFVHWVRNKILEHIEDQSLCLDPEMQEKERVEFFKNWINSIAIVYSLDPETSFENQQGFKQAIVDQSFNPLVLFGAIKNQIPSTSQSECFSHVWNILVLPSQSPNKNSQPSLMMQKFFEWSNKNLPPKMRSQHASIQTYENRSYYKATGEISLGIAAEKKKQASTIVSALLQTPSQTALVAKFDELSTNEISISDIDSYGLVAMFKHMEALRLQHGTHDFALQKNIQYFLGKQDVDVLYTRLLPLCEDIDSGGLISYLQHMNQQEFYKQLAVMRPAQATILLNKIKIWHYAENFDLQKNMVWNIYQAFHAQSETAFKDYLTAQCEYLVRIITTNKNSTRVTQQAFMERVRSLGSIASAFSIDNIQKLLEVYWQTEPLSSSNPLANDYFHCFTAFHSQISTSDVLKARILTDILENIKDENIMNRHELCWFIALAASQITKNSLLEPNLIKLCTLRNTSKNTPSSYLAPILAYVEVHYENITNSLLHEINHRKHFELITRKKECKTGELLNAYSKKPGTLVSSADAATQLFAMPHGRLGEVNLFWSELMKPKQTSRIFANPSSMLGGVPLNKSNAVGNLTIENVNL